MESRQRITECQRDRARIKAKTPHSPPLAPPLPPAPPTKLTPSSCVGGRTAGREVHWGGRNFSPAPLQHIPLQTLHCSPDREQEKKAATVRRSKSPKFANINDSSQWNDFRSTPHLQEGALPSRHHSMAQAGCHTSALGIQHFGRTVAYLKNCPANVQSESSPSPGTTTLNLLHVDVYPKLRRTPPCPCHTL